MIKFLHLFKNYYLGISFIGMPDTVHLTDWGWSITINA